MTQPVDPEFTRRLAQYQRNHKKGVVFQADGTLGGKRANAQRPAWRSTVFRQAIKVLIIGMMLKALVFHGAKLLGYDPLSFVMLDSSSIGQKGVALIFYPDPLSQEISHWLTLGQQYLAVEFRRAF